ncbi:MAG: metallophosphoesterase [Candidatus Woesearchaeota archaeon]|jgi:DNA polymerase II small subunit|nr:metallophosphoesterase [Candidatus Woesearchaeota archaeon]
MNNSDIELILEKFDIELIEKLEFESENQKLDFLNKLESIARKDIKLKVINNDLKEIINDFDLNEDNIKKLQKINWEDFTEIILSAKNNKRKKRIYENFILFIKSEIGLHVPEKPLHDKSLIDGKIDESGYRIDPKIFEKEDNFDIEEDTLRKAKEFGVDITFDYTTRGKKTTVNDFVLYFTKRLEYFTNLLEGRVNADNVMRISKLKDLFETNTVVTVIGLVSEIIETKNGHIMLTIEDKGGEIKCFINKDKKELLKIVAGLCLDEGIGILGKVGKNIIWTDEIIIPSPPNNSELKKTENGGYVACLSDIHFGSKVFVDEAFQKFIDWINGNTSSDELNELAKKVKYIVIAGDIIEGIGVYPGQGEDVRIFSTELQYHDAARWLSQIPKDKCIIIIPGNHDTSRLSEPQLKLSYEKTYALYNMENVIMVSNPSTVCLFSKDPSGGLDFYLYHGGSFFYYADKIQHLREKGGVKSPEEVVKYLLEKRHLAPSHGSTLYVPDSQNDPLVIKKMPDFFITGHTHKMSLANYKGCSIISCGCWVEMSDYQEKMGMYPDIGKVILVNTRTRKPQILNFYTEK